MKQSNGYWKLGGENGAEGGSIKGHKKTLGFFLMNRFTILRLNIYQKVSNLHVIDTIYCMSVIPLKS